MKQRWSCNFSTLDTPLLLVIVVTGLTRAVRGESLCGDPASSLEVNVVSSEGTTIRSTVDENKDKVNQEWLFRASDNSSFINLEFLKYELTGPTCTKASQPGISKVVIKTDVDENWYCKGRRTPDNMTGHRFLKISYCQKIQGGEILFRVKSSCNGTFLVKPTVTSIRIPYSRKSTCSVQLVSTNGKMMIKAMFEEVKIGAVRTSKCKGGYLSVEDGSERSLLPGNVSKLCNHEKFSQYRDGMSFDITSNIRSDRMMIRHKKVRFSLSFHMAEDIPVELSTPSSFTTVQPDFDIVITNATAGTTLKDSTMPDNGGKGLGHIIGIGCGAIFVMLSILFTLLLARRKNSKRSESRKMCNLTRGASENLSENESPTADSVRSINNAMYGKILDGEDEHFETGICRIVTPHIGDGLDRRNTQPQLTPPTQCSMQKQRPRVRTSNIYEKIEDIQTFKAVESRPLSCATFTSDEFSDDDGLATDHGGYSIILNMSSQCTAKRDQDEKLTPQGSTHYDKITSQLSIHPSITFGAVRTTFITSDNDIRLPKSHAESQRAVDSATLLGVNDTDRYASSRPSLPNITPIVLAEDAESYLSPRPSCPNVMADNGYSSTNDITEIQQRIFAAAHPSLIGTRKEGSSVPETTEYHSITVANEVRPSAHYSTPRQKQVILREKQETDRLICSDVH